MAFVNVLLQCIESEGWWWYPPDYEWFHNLPNYMLVGETDAQGRAGTAPQLPKTWEGYGVPAGSQVTALWFDNISLELFGYWVPPYWGRTTASFSLDILYYDIPENSDIFSIGYDVWWPEEHDIGTMKSRTAAEVLAFHDPYAPRTVGGRLPVPSPSWKHARLVVGGITSSYDRRYFVDARAGAGCGGINFRIEYEPAPGLIDYGIPERVQSVTYNNILVSAFKSNFHGTTKLYIAVNFGVIGNSEWSIYPLVDIDSDSAFGIVVLPNGTLQVTYKKAGTVYQQLNRKMGVEGAWEDPTVYNKHERVLCTGVDRGITWKIRN